MSISEGFAGRTLALAWNSSAVAGVREKSLTINGEAIDVTSDDDSGWRKLLEVAAQNQVDISVSGVTKSQVLKTDFFNGTRTRTASITYPDGAVLSGTFYLSEYTETGAYNDAVTFEATLMSSGAVIFTP